MTNEVAKNETRPLTIGERFTNMVLRELQASVGNGVQVTEQQRNLIMGYFIGIDRALATAEAKRLKDAAGRGDWAKRAQETLPYTWNNVSVDSKLAQSIMVYAKLGLDMTIPNHVFAIPYMNGKTGKYDMNFQEGYKGREMKAKKYSLYQIQDITAALVYATDEFTPYFKDKEHEYDTYELTVTNPFDRGAMVGGYVYIEFEDARQNKLFIMSKAEIDKRRDVAKSKTFWEKWYEEMALKTLVNAACNKKITLDPGKIDADYRLIQTQEGQRMETELEEEISANANREPINVTPPPAAIPQQMQPPAAISQHTQQTRQSVQEIKTPVEEAILAYSPMGPTVPPDEEIEF